jgi:hypothetical protein
LIEKIKLRFNNQKQKIQVIGYELSYRKDAKYVTKSFKLQENILPHQNLTTKQKL